MRHKAGEHHEMVDTTAVLNAPNPPVSPHIRLERQRLLLRMSILCSGLFLFGTDESAALTRERSVGGSGKEVHVSKMIVIFAVQPNINHNSLSRE
jgi:hypothetical protein